MKNGDNESCIMAHHNKYYIIQEEKEMKKNSFNKIMAVSLATTMILGLAGCGNTASTQEKTSENPSSAESTSTVSSETVDVQESGVTFPLEEEMTFDIMVSGDENVDMEKCAFWQDLYEATNVKINFIQIASEGFMGTMNAMFAAKQEGDAIIAGGYVSEFDFSLMAGNGLLLALDEYIEDTDIMPNFNERVLAESPETKGVIAFPDGNIYTLPRYDAFEASYLESPIWINKAWVDQLGKELPTTLEELEEILIAFRDNDMNGNGKNDDEIPYIFRNGSGRSHMEAILGLWGLATKDSSYENYVYVEDGVVKFAPTSQAYKDAVTVLNRWYENGLIWSECFTGTKETYSAKLTGELPLIGMCTDKLPPSTNSEDYVQLAPVKVEGYEPVWYVHPGYIGVKGQFSLTRSCENPEVLMHWIDLFYKFENTLRITNGELEDGRYEMVEGKVNILTLPADQKEALKESAPTVNEYLRSHIPYAYTKEDYAERMVLSESNQLMQTSFDIYEEYLNDEMWPRPYLKEEDTSRMSELRTDIFNTVAEKRAAWVTGVSDIDAEWDAYVESINNMGLDEFLEIMQRTYDNYLAGQE